MKLKQLMAFDNMFGLLNITSHVAKELNGASFSLGRWYDGTKDSEQEETFFNFQGMTEAERKVADMNIKTKLGNSETWSYFDTKDMTEAEIKDVYNDIACLFKTREEQLNRQFYSLLVKYNPINNYDKTETQTHNESNTIGERETTFVQGERGTTTTKGSRKDTTTDTQKGSPFDSAEYSKSKGKNVSELEQGQQIDSETTDKATDTTTQEEAVDSNTGGYSLRTMGNIGVTTSDELLQSFRVTALFSFHDELLKVIQEDMLKMVME